MEMTIDIDKSIKELSKWRKNLNYDNGDYCYGDDTTKHSLDVALDTMRKYQKIQELLNDGWNRTNAAEMLLSIEEVVEDGNDK